MKANKVAAALAVVGAGVQAQSSQPVSYTTVTYDTCPTSVVESLITVTNGVTVTYCPLCDQGGAQPTGPSGSGMAPPPSGGETTHTTVYTTVYESLCPTGVTQQTYTITESCTGPTPSWNTDSSHIPPDFTVTVETCHVCESTPVPKTITKPCGCKASEGVTMPPNQPNAAPTPPPGGSPPPPPPGGNGAPPPPPGGNGGSGAQCPGPQCKGDSNNNGGSGSPGSGDNNGGSGAQCPGPQCNGGSGSPGSGNNNGGSGSGSGSPMGGNNGTAPGCPGPQCQNGMPSGPGCPGPQCQNGMSTAPAAPGSASGPSGSTPTSGPNACPGPQCKTSPSPQPYTGAAANFGAAGIVSTLFVAAVAALAFGL